MLEHIGLYGLRGGLTGWGQKYQSKVDTKSVNNAINNGKNYKIGKAEVIRGGSDLTIVDLGCYGSLGNTGF